MKALIYSQYGNPDVLQVQELPVPKPGAKELLIKVFAASVNSRDWDMLTGKPAIYKLLFGWPKPKYSVIGTDIAGVVQEIGDEVRGFKAGDMVFGANPDGGYGAFAEYIILSQNNVCLKPPAMSMFEAAAIPEAGQLAFQAFEIAGQLKPGASVLINGAGGGAGTFAIQMAKQAGANVTAVDKQIKHLAMKDIGADIVLDYYNTDFATLDNRYDLIIDFVATRSFWKIRRLLMRNGTYVIVGGQVGKIIKLILWNLFIPKSQNRRICLLAYKMNTEQLKQINILYQNELLKPVIDKIFKLEEGAKAMHYFHKGDFVGKIVVEV